MKMRYYLSILIIALFQFSCQEDLSVSYIEPANLIQGFSFEGDDLTEWWSFSQPEDVYTKERTDEESFDGDGSLLLSSETTSNGSFAFWSTRITDLEEGLVYKVRARIKGKDIDEDSFAINMFARDSNNSSSTISGLSGDLSPTKDWVEVTIEMQSPMTSNFNHIDVYFILYQEVIGTVYIDKVELFY